MTVTALVVLLLVLLTTISFTAAFNYVQLMPSPVQDYNASRRTLVSAEASMMIGGRLKLNWKEHKVDVILKRLKRQELIAGVSHPETFAPALHFFNAKPLIERSGVFKMLQKMPKGAMLHGHNSAMVSSEWIITNLTYRSDVMKCTRSNGHLILTFRRIAWHNCSTDYVSIDEERRAAVNVDIYDQQLEKHINLYTPQPAVDYPNINVVWDRFNAIFETVSDIINFESTYDLVYTRILQELYEDHIMYVEIRTAFKAIYYKNGRAASELEVVEKIKQVVENFKKTHPNFLGAKFIFSMSRNKASQLGAHLDLYQQLQSAHPDIVIGLDFINQEDTGTPLFDFADKLLPTTGHVHYFLHAGETNWNGYSSDRNLFDAILLNTTRIGHGYALYKHPVLLSLIQQRRICIEVCPISNQVLKLVTDMRNHPANFYVSHNFPIVIASDDPGFWNAKGLSYDLYYALMSMTPAFAGLQFLKQLAMNSIKFSILNVQERYRAASVFNHQWNAFLDNVIHDNQFS